jgi:hypothetical protein
LASTDGSIFDFCVSITSVTSTSLSSQACSAAASVGDTVTRSGTTPEVIAETIFCRSGANGTML